MTIRNSRGKNLGSARENLGAIFKGLGELMERIGDLGGELTRRFEAGEKGEAPKHPFKAVYGFSIKVGAQGEGVKVEPFGNISPEKKRAEPKKDSAGAEVKVHEVREPLVDIFEEGEDGALCRIIAELPGISEKDLSIELEADILVLSAQNADKHYHKELLLPRPYDRNKMTVSCNNGIVDILLKN